MATHGLKAPAPPVNKSALYVQKQPQKELEQPQWKHQQHDAGLRDIVRNFSAWASIDGIPHIVLTENWILRILWIIITTACFGAAIYQLITLIIQYFKYPVDLLTSIEFTPLAVPTVTLCNINPWKRSQIRDTPLEDLVTAYESFDASAEYGFESPPTEAKQWRAKNWMWLMGDALIEMDRNGTAPIGYDWDDLFISCTYNSDPCNASDFIDFYDVYYGHCYMFNVNGTQTSTRAGPAYGLRLVMRIVQQEYLPWIASMGAVVFMDRAGATPFEEIYGYYASVGEASEFGVHYIERSKLSKPFSNCTNSIQGVSQKIYYFNDYEVEACVRSCSQDKIVNDCGCYAPQYNKPINSTAKGSSISCYDMANKSKALNCINNILNFQHENSSWNVYDHCQCPFACDQSYYQISASIAKWPARAYMLPECAASNQIRSPYWSNAAECVEFYKSNTLLMDVYFETTSKEVQKEFQGYKVLNFVADAGGTIGLWLGMSIVSVIEFLLFLFMLCRYFINRPAKVKIDPGFDYFASLQQQTQFADLYHLDDHEEETLPPPVQDSR